MIAFHRALALVVLTLLMVAPFSETSQADVRVALVIGNGAYENAPKLPNPPNDAADVAAALKRSGFETILATDLDKRGMEDAEVRFARAARDADVALFYYSGHALQFSGINYLAPVDAKLTDEADLRRMFRVDDMIADLQQAKNLRILVLDSCRDNPLAEQLKRSIGKTRAFSLERGLAKVDSPQGMIVAYATQAGRTADDGNGRNSPYTAAFLRNIEAQEEIGTVFRHITADVYNATKHEQLPELSLSLIGDYYLRERASPAASAPAQPAALEQKPAPSAQKSDDRLLARVNGTEIRESDVKVAEQELGAAPLEQMDAAARRKNIVNFLIDMKVLLKAAEEQKLQENDVFRTAMESVQKRLSTLPDDEFKPKRYAFQHDRLLMDTLLTIAGKNATTEEAIRKVYDDSAKGITGQQEVHARHILVKTEDEAKQIVNSLRNGADFAELAKKKSIDPGASAGGDLGFFTRDQMVPEFSAVAFALEPGKISAPVKTQFGWHVIKVDEKRNRKAPDFEQVKPQIETYVTRKAQADFITRQREGAKIERFDLTAQQ